MSLPAFIAFCSSSARSCVVAASKNNVSFLSLSALSRSVVQRVMPWALASFCKRSALRPTRIGSGITRSPFFSATPPWSRMAQIERIRCWFMPMRPAPPLMMMPSRCCAMISPGNLSSFLRRRRPWTEERRHGTIDGTRRKEALMARNDSPPKLKAPAGACDTHMHIYDGRYPSAPTAPFTPPDALVPDYLKVRARLGITRTVVVQPSTYGKDNSCTLAAIAALGDGARGIAVVDQTVTDTELDRLTTAGIRGIRFHMLPGGALPWDILETMAARVRNFGWHVQLQLDGRTLPDREALLKKLPGTLVVDHVGKLLETV